MDWYLVRTDDFKKAIDFLDEGYEMMVDLYTLKDIYENAYCLTDFRVVRVESDKVDGSWAREGIIIASVYDIWEQG